MKFNLFGKGHKCTKCGKKFKNEIELTDHTRYIQAKLFFAHEELRTCGYNIK